MRRTLYTRVFWGQGTWFAWLIIRNICSFRTFIEVYRVQREHDQRLKYVSYHDFIYVPSCSTKCLENQTEEAVSFKWVREQNDGVAKRRLRRHWYLESLLFIVSYSSFSKSDIFSYPVICVVFRNAIACRNWMYRAFTESIT
jgi:hypothetical protein